MGQMPKMIYFQVDTSTESNSEVLRRRDRYHSTYSSHPPRKRKHLVVMYPTAVETIIELELDSVGVFARRSKWRTMEDSQTDQSEGELP